MNAEEARNNSLQAHKKELESVLTMVKISSQMGKYHHESFGWLSDYTISELQKLGYTAKNFTDEIIGSPEWCGGPITGIRPILKSDRMHIVRWKESETPTLASHTING